MARLEDHLALARLDLPCLDVLGEVAFDEVALERAQLRFDPALFLSGETANVAAAEDGAVPPGEPVPNDNYVVDEGHRLFTYIVPSNAKVAVLAKSPESVPITVAELAQIVAGDHKPLWEPIETGFWLRALIDTARSLDQQYRP